MALTALRRLGRTDVATVPILSRWPGWRRLPRDARDTIFLLGVIGWTVLPHVSHLPVWCSLLTLVMLLWRARLALANAPLPGRWVLIAVLVLAAVLTLWSHRTLLGKEAGVTMAVVLMALKTLELRARRDAFVVFFLGFFIVLTHFLYSQSLAVAAAMLVSVWGLMTALVLAHMPVGKPGLRHAGGLALRTALWGAPIMALLFVLFPRIGPLWGVPNDGLAKTGLSATMRLGSVAEIAQDDAVALRLRFDGPLPPPSALYFRGPVLARFDGREWTREGTHERTREGAAGTSPAAIARMSSGLQVSGAPVRYEMTLEPLQLASLPLLDATPEAPTIENASADASPVAGPDLQWLLSRPTRERLRLKAASYPRFSYGAGLRTLTARPDVELPPGFNPRTLAWAESLRRDPLYANASARVMAGMLLQHIRTAGFSYTLAPGEYGADAIDEFWFDRREGFCEHFAAAFVVLMRALDVPARVVTGYQGVDPVAVDGYYVVRQSAAHAWAEYWEAGSGWVRVDPTAAVAPDRINRGRRLAPAPGIVAGALNSVDPELLASLQSSWELLNNRWNQWVLNYSRGQQFDVLKQLGIASPNWEDLALLLIGAFSTLALGGALWAWWDHRRIDPWVRQMTRVRASLHALGLEVAAHEPARTLAARVRERFGAQATPLTDLLDALERQRYSRETRPRPDAGLTRQFALRARALRGAVG